MSRMTRRPFAVAAGVIAASVIARRAVRISRRLDFAGTSVIITGGSRGLGLLVARQLADEGARLTLAARDPDELERARRELIASGAEVDAVVCDISIPAQAIALVDHVATRTGRVDVLINNAGTMTVAPIDHMEIEDFEEAMAVHFRGPLHTMLAAVPVMRRQGAGRIVNVSSIAGKIGVPHMTPYCASKFALAGLSDSLRAELAGDGIHVTTVFPGLMRTGSPFNALFKGRHREEFAWFTIADSLPVATVDGRRAAAKLVDACRYGDAELVIGWPARLAALAQALAPGLVAEAAIVADRLVLPPADEASGTEGYSGWQSVSSAAPSGLTRLTNEAAIENNEIG